MDNFFVLEDGQFLVLAADGRPARVVLRLSTASGADEAARMLRRAADAVERLAKSTQKTNSVVVNVRPDE